MNQPRRLPAPWGVVEYESAFVVVDASMQKLAHIYFEDEPGRRRVGGFLTKDEARRIAKAITRLPDLLRKPVAIPDHQKGPLELPPGYKRGQR